MKIAIYQINAERDENNVSFIEYKALSRLQGTDKIRSRIYDCIYRGDVPLSSLEEVFYMFNVNIPNAYRFRALSVSDVVEIEDGKEEERGFYFCDCVGFVKVPFDKTLTQDKTPRGENMDIEKLREKYPKGCKIRLINMQGEKHMPPGLTGYVDMVDGIGQIHVNWENGSTLALNETVDRFEKTDPEPEKLKVLLVPYGRYPETVEIENSLESMQKLVGGLIEQYMPFTDEVSIICNEEGKINSLPLNRAVFDDNGKIMDIIAGDFFLVHTPPMADGFSSMPEQLLEKYERKFHLPERFLNTDRGLAVVEYHPKKNGRERY